MANVRHKDPRQLMNPRGGRGRGVVVVARTKEWRPPTLPRQVTEQLTDPVQARFQATAVRHARTVWAEWWKSQPARAVNASSDLEAISWWIICVFRRALYVLIVREQPLVKGSHGQPMTNPLERTISRLTEDINRAEAKFGMNTKDRFQMQFQDASEMQQPRTEGGIANVHRIDDERRRRILGEAE